MRVNNILLFFLFSFYFAAQSISQSNTHFPIPLGMDIYNKGIAATDKLKFLLRTNPSVLSSEQLAIAGIVHLGYEGYIEKSWAPHIKSFINSCSCPATKKAVNYLVDWYVKNDRETERDDAFNKQMEVLIESENAYSEYLNTWIEKNLRFITYDGKPYSDQASKAKMVNPILHRAEFETNKEGAEVIYLSDNMVKYRDSRNKYTVNTEFRSDGQIMNRDSNFILPTEGISLWYMDQKGHTYLKEEKGEYFYYHPNGKLSIKSSDLLSSVPDISTIIEAFDIAGKPSFKNGNGLLYYSILDGGNVYSTELTYSKNVVIRRKLYFDNSVLYEHSYDAEGNMKSAIQYSWKNGKKLSETINDEDKIYEENIPLPSSYKIGVKLSLKHGISLDGPVYPIASPSYTAPKIINEADMIQNIKTQLQELIDWSSPYLEKYSDYTFELNTNGKQPNEEGLDSLTDYIYKNIKINSATLDGKPLNDKVTLIVHCYLQ